MSEPPPQVNLTKMAPRERFRTVVRGIRSWRPTDKPTYGEWLDIADVLEEAANLAEDEYEIRCWQEEQTERWKRDYIRIREAAQWTLTQTDLPEWAQKPLYDALDGRPGGRGVSNQADTSGQTQTGIPPTDVNGEGKSE